MSRALHKSHSLERFALALAAFVAIHLGQAQRQFHVFFQRHFRKEIERLKDHPNGAAAVLRELNGTKLRQISAVGDDRARGGPVQARHQI